MVDAVPDFGVGIGDVLRIQTFVDRLPSCAAIIGAESARRRNRDVDALGIAGIENDGVQAHASGARLPVRPGAMLAETGKLLPGLPAVGGAEKGGIFHAGVDGVRIGERGLQMPDALEFPGMGVPSYH